MHKQRNRILTKVFSTILVIALLIGSMTVFAEGSQEQLTDTPSSLGTSKNEEEQSKPESDGTQTTESEIEEILISSLEDLKDFAKQVNDGDSMFEKEIILTEDISLTEEWTPIGKEIIHPFSGTFDGNGHTISGLSVSSDTMGGFFGYLLDATIKNVDLANPQAVNSTGGLFYVATRTTFENCNFTAQNNAGALFSRAIMTPFSSPPIEWSDAPPTGPNKFATVTPNAVYTIDTAHDWTYFRDAVNAGTDFTDATVMLTTSINLNSLWSAPIGSIPIPFNGIFDGQGYSINNLRANGFGLFGTAHNATINNLKLVDPQIDNSSGSGILAENFIDSSASYITIDGGYIKGNYTSGIVGLSDYASKGTSIEFCLLDGVTIEGTSSAHGIATNINNYAANSNVIYGCDISSPAYAAGITFQLNGPGGSYSSASQNIVMQTAISSIGSADGIYNSGISWSAATDNFVTNVDFSGSTNPYLVSRAQIRGSHRNLTDDPTNTDVILLNDSYISENIWDSISARDDDAANFAYSTGYLTNGSWTPSDDFWTPREGDYPQITSLTTSKNEAIRGISGLASLALRPVNELENYRDGVKELRIPKYTTSGHEIIWDYNLISGIESETHVQSNPNNTYLILYTEQNADIPAFDLTAEIIVNGKSYEKNFTDVKINDRILREDYNARSPHILTDNDESTSLLVPTDLEFSRTFLDPIEENPNIIGQVRLYRQLNGGSWVLDQTFAAKQDPSNKFQIIGNKVLFDFTLLPNTNYRMVQPSGTVKELNKDNESDAINVYFHTPGTFQPFIEVHQTLLNGANDTPFPIENILKNFTVYQSTTQKGSTSPADIVYDYNLGVGTATQYTGSWDDDDPLQSMTDAMASDLPNEGVLYYISSDKLISNTPSPGTFRVYIMAKNNAAQTTTSAFYVTIAGSAYWATAPLSPAVHMPWTATLSAVVDAARQGAVAAVDSGGNVLPVAVLTHVDEGDWADAIEFTDGPSSIDVRVYALDSAGDICSSTDETITVYLDKHLSYQMTLSPVTMNYTLEKRIEEKMNFSAWNFKHTDLIIEHNDNNYRTPGIKYIDVTCESQYVTDCPNKNCTYTGIHPSDTISDTFIVNIIYPPGQDIEISWGEYTDAIRNHTYEEGQYSTGVIEVEPTSYLLPNYVLEALSEQSYSKLQIEFLNKYRWVIYSDSLTSSSRYWHEQYDLQIRSDENSDVLDLIGGRENGFAFRFEQTGKLFGSVEIEFNLEKAEAAHKNLSGEILGLYQYNPKTNKLDLVSDTILVDDGEWVSAVVDTLAPTTYVLKAKDPTDKIVSDSISSNLVSEFYVGTRTTGKYGEYHQERDADRKLVHSDQNLDDIFMISSSALPADGKLDKNAGKINRTSIIAISIVLVAITVGAVIVLYLRRRNHNGEENK